MQFPSQYLEIPSRVEVKQKKFFCRHKNILSSRKKNYEEKKFFRQKKIYKKEMLEMLERNRVS